MKVKTTKIAETYNIRWGQHNFSFNIESKKLWVEDKYSIKLPKEVIIELGKILERQS